MSHVNSVKVVIAGYFGYPYGGAPATRIRNFAMGLRSSGAEVRVLPMAPMELKEAASLRKPIEYEGVSYENIALFNLTENKPSTNQVHELTRKIRWFWALYGTVPYSYQKLKHYIAIQKCDLLIVYSRSYLLVRQLIKLCKKNKIPTILDVTELAESFDGLGGKLNPMYWDWQLGANYMPRDFDVVSAITQALADKYEAMGCQRVLVIPSIESWDNLLPVEPLPPRAQFQLVYVGALIDRDAPDVLLEAICLLHQRDVPVQLDVIGRYARNSEGQRRMALIQSDPVLQTCVNLVGEVSDTELVERLRQADGLVLLRRDAPTEVAAFPTRLVEYLKQGRPVFVSDVGDIRIYLRHEEDAMLLSPHDPVQVADTIAAIISRPDRGFALGVQGQARGAACFDRQYHAQRLLDLI